MDPNLEGGVIIRLSFIKLLALIAQVKSVNLDSKRVKVCK